MEVAEGHEITLQQPRQEAEVHPIGKLRVKIIHLQVDLEIYDNYFSCQVTLKTKNRSRPSDR